MSNLAKLKTHLPVDALIQWERDSSPYGTDFSPSFIYEDILSILGQYEQPSALCRLASQGTIEHKAVNSAAFISQIFRAHGKLMTNWIENADSIDVILPSDAAVGVTQSHIDQLMQEVISLSLAGRKPLIVCPTIYASESDWGGGISTMIRLPELLLSLIQALSPLLTTNRCIVIPAGERIDSCLLSDVGEGGTFELNLMPRYVEDVLAADDFTFRKFSPKQIAGTIPMVGVRPVIKVIGLSSSYPVLIEKHQDSYSVYQSLVAGLCAKISSAKTEAEARQAISEFDAEIALLEIRYKNLKRELEWRGITTLVGLVATILCITIPTNIDLMKYLLGSATLWEGISYLKAVRQTSDDMKESRFWFPWYARKQSE